MLGKVGKSLVNNSFQNNFDFHVWAKCIVQMLLCGGFYFSRKKKKKFTNGILTGSFVPNSFKHSEIFFSDTSKTFRFSILQPFLLTYCKYLSIMSITIF